MKVCGYKALVYGDKRMITVIDKKKRYKNKLFLIRKVFNFDLQFQFTLLIMIAFGFLLIHYIGSSVICINPAHKNILVLISNIPVDRDLQRMKSEAEKSIRVRDGQNIETQRNVKEYFHHKRNILMPNQLIIKGFQNVSGVK